MKTSRKTKNNAAKDTKWYAVPYYLWMVIFIVVPLLLVLFFSFTDADYNFTFENFEKFFAKSTYGPTQGQMFYVQTLLRSLLYALIATAVCLVLGYPVASILASNRFKHGAMIITIIILPMWMNFVLRTYAWMNILGRNGLLDQLVQLLGGGPLEIMNTEFSVILGLVYNFLPFMILPIYSVMKKTDSSLIEAAEDLGANSFNVFMRVKLPLSLPGVISGIVMVFMPAASTFVISSMLGGSKVNMIGNVIESEFTKSPSYNFGSALSMILMVLILLSMLILNKFQKGEKGEILM